MMTEHYTARPVPFRAEAVSLPLRSCRDPVSCQSSPMAASSSNRSPIFRSGEDCRHFNFNSYSGIAVF